jgi:hypothetical protein
MEMYGFFGCLVVFAVVSGILFISAVFNIDWVMSKMRGDRMYGRKISRIYHGFVGLVGILLVLFLILIFVVNAVFF